MNNIKRKIGLVTICAWTGLGFNRGINSYNYQQKEVGQKEIDFKTPVTKPIEKPVVKILNKTPEVKVEKPEVKVEKKSFAVSLLWGMFKYQKD